MRSFRTLAASRYICTLLKFLDVISNQIVMMIKYVIYLIIRTISLNFKNIFPFYFHLTALVECLSFAKNDFRYVEEYKLLYNFIMN